MSDDKIVEVYSADHLIDAENVRFALAEEGISVKVVGAPLQNILGELPAQLGAPRLWVREEDFERASRIVGTIKQEQRERELARSEWVCEHCGEKNSADFEICWYCQTSYESQNTAERQD